MPGFRVQNGQVITEGIWTGDVIRSASGKRLKVTKINPKNYRCIDEHGQTWNSPRFAGAVKDEDQSWDGPKEKTEYELYLEAQAAGLTLGVPVKITDPKHARSFPGTYVIIQSKSDGTFRMAKLGGDGGRYLRGFKASQLERVEV